MSYKDKLDKKQYMKPVVAPRPWSEIYADMLYYDDENIATPTRIRNTGWAPKWVVDPTPNHVVDYDIVRYDGIDLLAGYCTQIKSLSPTEDLSPSEQSLRCSLTPFEEAERRYEEHRKSRSAKEIKKRLGWKEQSPAQQDANLDYNLRTTK